MLPRTTQTERIAWRLHSSARPCARFSSAARAAVACANPGMPRRGEKPPKTTSPPSPGIIERVATSRVSSQAASIASRWTARIPLLVISSAGAVNCPPALLTSTSTASKRSRVPSTSART